ncbi:MAG: OmpA family protein, partial [Acidimicrobiales bacterium]
AVLADIAESLNRVPDVPFEVVGHTDDVGEEQDNLLLSEQRAEAVVERLAELGVDPGRMTARGEGETNPIADNNTDEGKAANRRIEFILVGTSNP